MIGGCGLSGGCRLGGGEERREGLEVSEWALLLILFPLLFCFCSVCANGRKKGGGKGGLRVDFGEIENEMRLVWWICAWRSSESVDGCMDGRKEQREREREKAKRMQEAQLTRLRSNI